MKKTFKQFLVDANISDLDVFKNNQHDPNQPVYDKMVSQQLKMEQLFEKHLERDVERVLRMSHQQYTSFKGIWNAMVRSNKDNTLRSFLQALHMNYDLVRNLAEVYGTCNALDDKTDGEFISYIEEHQPDVARMLKMYDLIVQYRERYT